jgi:superfamily II DNA helicase RecQ
MQDQVSNFTKRGIPSDYYCSTRTDKERDNILRRLQAGSSNLRLLFITPESFGADQ